jgi:transcriptional regulator with XRE-family HTH domain
MTRKAKRAAKKAPAALGDPVVAGNIRSKLAERGLLPAHLAKRLGLTSQAVSQWLQCQTTPSAQRLGQIAAVLDVTVEALRRRSETSEVQQIVSEKKSRADVLRLRLYPLGGTADISGGGGDEWLIPAKEFQGLTSAKPDLRLMRIAGNDLEPNLRAGDLVLTDRRWEVVSAAGIYLLGDRRFPVLRRCELAMRSGKQVILVHEHGVPQEVSADSLSVIGRVICKLIVPL